MYKHGIGMKKRELGYLQLLMTMFWVLGIKMTVAPFPFFSHPALSLGKNKLWIPPGLQNFPLNPFMLGIV